MREYLTTMLSLTEESDLDSQTRDAQWRIGHWSGEFVDARTEHLYRRHAQRFLARQLILALGTWLVLMMLFVVPDFLAFGWGPRFWGLLVMRVLVALCVLGLLRAVLRNPMVAARGQGATAVLCVGMVGYLLVFALRPEVAIWTYALTPLVLIMLFVFVPNRLIYATAVAVTMAVLTAIMVGYSHQWQWRDQAVWLVVLSVPVFTGYVTARRMQILQRKQYAQVMATQRANVQLLQEAAQRAVLEEALRVQASEDPLTGLNNRREYEKRFRHEMARARREGTPLSLALLDLDHFKHINDDCGHAAGDAVLKALAQLLREQLRDVDITGRLGGEEFTVLMPNTPLLAAGAAMERLQQALARLEVVSGEHTLHVRATIGISQLQRGKEGLDALIHRADEALYAGKKAGRNRIMLAMSTGEILPYPPPTDAREP